MLNHISIMGRLTRDPELRKTQSGTSVTSFTVAVDRDYTSEGGERGTDFIDCVSWRAGADFVAKYFRKGSMIVVDGRLQSRKWQDRDGNNRTSWEVLADRTYFGESKRDSSGENSGYRTAAGAVNVPTAEGDGFTDLGSGFGEGNPFRDQGKQQRLADLPDDDGDLPF